MKRGTKKSPVSKEQLFQAQERAYERQFIKEKFFPALTTATKSVDEAGMLLQAMTSLIMEEALEVLKTKKIHEIQSRLVKKLCPDNERLLEIEGLIHLFEKQTLFKARGYLEGMKGVLEQCKIDEMQKRTLSSMEVDWDRYLTK